MKNSCNKEVKMRLKHVHQERAEAGGGDHPPIFPVAIWTRHARW